MNICRPHHAEHEDDAEHSADNAEHINYKELWVAKEALVREPAWLCGWRVVFRVDNAAAEHYINFRYGKVLSLQALAEEFEFAERAAGCWALAKHLAGTANVISDAGSRDAAFAQRWQSDASRETGAFRCFTTQPRGGKTDGCQGGGGSCLLPRKVEH